MHSSLEEIRYALWMKSLQTLGKALLHLGYRYEAHGTEHIPKEGGALIVSNHVSFHDWLFIGATLPRKPRFVMHQHHHQYPLLRAFFDASRVIPIAPKKQDPARLEAAMEAIDQALANGEVVVIFPEGNMTPDGHLQAFRPGLERIVQKRPVPVIPIGISGLFGSFFSKAHGEPMSGKPQRFRAPVRVEIGAPIAPHVATAELVKERIATMIGEPVAQGATESAHV
jgi:1-acyl-sn-glycerol-3-phosphate acyltransferase